MKSVTWCGVAASRSMTLATPPPIKSPKPTVGSPRRARSPTTRTTTATITVAIEVSSVLDWSKENEIPELYCRRSQIAPPTWMACVASAWRAQTLESASIAVTTRAITMTVKLIRSTRRLRGTRHT